MEDLGLRPFLGEDILVPKLVLVSLVLNFHIPWLLCEICNFLKCQFLCVLVILLYLYSSRKVKDAWETKRDVLVKSGAFAIEQLSEALSATASSNKLADGTPQQALHLCVEQVGFACSSQVLQFGCSLSLVLEIFID